MVFYCQDAVPVVKFTTCLHILVPGQCPSSKIVLYLTLPIMKKKYVEILLHYRWLFVKGNVFIGEWGIFGAEVFLCYSQFFIKGNFVIGGVECIWYWDGVPVPKHHQPYVHNRNLNNNVILGQKMKIPKPNMPP